MKSTVKERLIAFISYLSMSKNAFENACGLSTRYVSNISTSVSPDKLKRISLKFPELNVEWLLTGQGEMLREINSTSTIQGDITVNGNHNSHIGHGAIHCEGCGRELDTRSNELVYPIVPTEVIKAPDVNIAEWLEENLDQCKKIDLHKLIGKISHVQPMTSRAMEPRIPEGALLFMREVNSWDEALLDGSVYGVDVNKPHMIVRKVYDEGEFIRCEPVNPEFGAVRVPKSKVMNLYKIRVGLKVFE
jgi:hypothetical protein